MVRNFFRNGDAVCFRGIIRVRVAETFFGRYCDRMRLGVSFVDRDSGAESQWGILKVSMPTKKELNNLFQQFLDWFEDLFPMLFHYFDGAKQ